MVALQKEVNYLASTKRTVQPQLGHFSAQKVKSGKSERSHPSASETESKRKLLNNCTTYDQAFVEKSEELLNARYKISLS